MGASSAVKARGNYMGLRGESLSMAVSIIATTGFVLFGYDQGTLISHDLSTLELGN
jgi:hypothetical protein